MPADDPGVRAVRDAILQARGAVPAAHSALVAVSGIDGCGKGFVTAGIAAALRAHSLRVAVINIDGWLNLPAQRFSSTAPAEHFYRHAIRFDVLFADLVLPLRERRSLRVETDHADETATAFRRREYAFEDVDIIVLEGIFLLKAEFRRHYDLAVWVECSFATALERAVARSQEGLPPEETIRAYETIYHAAQRIHLARDDPRGAATLVIDNDLTSE